MTPNPKKTKETTETAKNRPPRKSGGTFVITNEQDVLPIDEALIRRVLRSFSELDGYRLSLVYLDDPGIQALNERYLKKAEPTDVLAFSLGPREGEIIVSAETALREAEKRQIPPEGELLLYTFHGALHLLGYDDKDPAEAATMHQREKEWLAKLGYPWSWDD